MPGRAKGRSAATRPTRRTKGAAKVSANSKPKATRATKSKATQATKPKASATSRASTKSRPTKRTHPSRASARSARTRTSAAKVRVSPTKMLGSRGREATKGATRTPRARAAAVKQAVTTIFRPVSTPFIPPAGPPAVRTIIRTIAIAPPPPARVAEAYRPAARPTPKPVPRPAKESPPLRVMPTRALGRHSHVVSVLGFGTGRLERASQSEALRTVHEALDKGVTLIETGPHHGEGRAERWLGIALHGAARATTTLCVRQHSPMRDYKTAMAGLEGSLARLRTDHADIWLIDEVIFDNDPEWIYAHGALDAALEARDQGKVRFIGFAGHKSPHILLKLLGKGHDWDVVAMPLNPLDAHFRSFERQALPELVRRGIAVIGLKPFAGGALSRSRLARPDEVLRYALSLPVSSVIVGAESRAVLRKSLSIARDGTLFHAGDMDAIRAKTKTVAGDGRYERYKTTTEMDGVPGLTAHGYLTPGQRARR